MSPEGNRRIIHIDLDAFFASVEELLDPSLKGKPVIVGADPQGRGVVAAASYAARRYGVHSAMPIRQAARLCPQAVFRPVRREIYSQYSARVMALLAQYTPRLEKVSIDEAFLDVTGSEMLLGPAEEMARTIQRRIAAEIGLPCSLGVARNKLAAKIASDAGKPGGLVVVPPREEAAFLAPFPVEKLWGVGPKTAAQLHALGVRTVGELAAFSEEVLRRKFGSYGAALHQRASGQDDSPVVPEREAKSISREHTFAQDTADEVEVKRCLLTLSDDVARQLRQEGLRARTVTLKLRYHDFTTITRRVTSSRATALEKVLYEHALALLQREWKGTRRIRLVGVGASNLAAAEAEQLDLFDPNARKMGALSQVADQIRSHYGEGALRRALRFGGG